MRRREFITLLGNVVAAASWPRGASAQQGEPLRRIGVLMNRAADDPSGQGGVAAFRQALQQLSWVEDRNMRIDTRWGENNPDLVRKYAAELISLSPEVILAVGTLGAMALQHLTRTLPIVFVNVTDPVGAGLVNSLAQPGGNLTGFMLFEYSSSGKWLELLKQIAPNVTRAAVLRDPANPAGLAQFSAIQAIAQSLGVEVSPIGVRDASEIERAVAAFAASPGGGLIVTGTALTSVNRNLIIALAAGYKLPTVYSDRLVTVGGGLLSYGPDRVELYKHAAGYVDRILKGEKPADLPVQVPTKYELVINLKTAKALGLAVPPSLLARADEVIE
jgi:putative tryptophan/tyrosine transport system substrate-binding protein